MSDTATRDAVAVPVRVARRERPAETQRRIEEKVALPEKRIPRKPKGAPGSLPVVALVRGPIVSTRAAVNNEATPCLAYAYLSAYVANHGYQCTVVDGIGEALNSVWPLEKHPNFQCHGLTFDEILDRVPADAEVLGFSSFAALWGRASRERLT